MTEDAEKFAAENKAIRDLINQILNQSDNNDDQKQWRKIRKEKKGFC